MEELNNWKEVIQNNSILNIIGEHLLKSEIMSVNNDLKNKKIYATTLEAYIYAKYKIDGLEECYKFIENNVITSFKVNSIYMKIVEVIEQKVNENSNGECWEMILSNFKSNYFIS